MRLARQEWVRDMVDGSGGGEGGGVQGKFRCCKYHTGFIFAHPIKRSVGKFGDESGCVYREEEEEEEEPGPSL